MSIHVHVLTLLQVWHIMQNAKYGTDEDQIGVLRLVQNNSFSGYYPLHEVCMLYVCFVNCRVSSYASHGLFFFKRYRAVSTIQWQGILHLHNVRVTHSTKTIYI